MNFLPPPGTLSVQLVRFWCSIAVMLLEVRYVQPPGESPHCVAPLLRALNSSDPEYRNIPFAVVPAQRHSHTGKTVS